MNNTLLLLCASLLVLCHVGWTADIVIRPNLVTAECPNGRVYTTECKKCFCKDNVNNSPHWPYPYCRKDKCDAWKCPDPPVFTRECEGQCVCNATTSITICDKYCEERLQQTQGKPVIIQHQDPPEVSLDFFNLWSTL